MNYGGDCRTAPAKPGLLIRVEVDRAKKKEWKKGKEWVQILMRKQEEIQTK